MLRINTVPNIKVWRSLTRKLTEQQCHLICNGTMILTIILSSDWFVQQWWRILNARQFRWNNSWTNHSRSSLIDRHHGVFKFAARSTKEQGSNQSKFQWLPLRPNGDQQNFVVTGHNRLLAATVGNTLKVPQSFQCGRNIFSIIPHRFRVEASFSLREVVIGWRQTKPQAWLFAKWLM